MIKENYFSIENIGKNNVYIGNKHDWRKFKILKPGSKIKLSLKDWYIEWLKGEQKRKSYCA